MDVIDLIKSSIWWCVLFGDVFDLIMSSTRCFRIHCLTSAIGGFRIELIMSSICCFRFNWSFVRFDKVFFIIENNNKCHLSNMLLLLKVKVKLKGTISHCIRVRRIYQRGCQDTLSKFQSVGGKWQDKINFYILEHKKHFWFMTWMDF